MADNFVLRWEINNPAAAHAAGKAESGVFDEGGFKWSAAFERQHNPIGFGFFYLRCGVDHNEPWKCDAEVTWSHFMNGRKCSDSPMRLSFNNDNSSRMVACVPWGCLVLRGLVVNDVYTVEFDVRLIQGSGSIAEFLSLPNRKSNVILKIGDEKLHVSKEFLAVHSPVFDRMFFGDFAENGREEVEIKDVVYQEFIDLLRLLYLDTTEITDRTVPHIVKLADRFQMERVLAQSKKHLMLSSGLDVMKKLLLADLYNIGPLKDECLQSFTDGNDALGKLKSPEYAQLSGDMKIAICDRIAEL